MVPTYVNLSLFLMTSAKTKTQCDSVLLLILLHTSYSNDTLKTTAVHGVSQRWAGGRLSIIE